MNSNSTSSNQHNSEAPEPVVDGSTPRASFSSSTPSLSVRARRALYETTLGARRGNVPHVPLGSGSPVKQLRRPLGFLSPNFLKQQGRPGFDKRSSTSTEQQSAANTGNSARTNEVRSVSQLQQEISDLQYRLEALDVSHVIRNPKMPSGQTADANDPLLEFALSPQDYQHVKELNQKLQQIQSGLIDIEGERCLLVARAQQLEQEKEQLSKQLGLREREIEALQKRCAAAAEQSKVNAALRTTNQQLESDLKELQSQQSTTSNEANEEHVIQVMELQVQLQQSEAARDGLAQRLQSVERDHDGVCASLVQCLASVEKLTNETTQWEAERERLIDEHESQLELQRIDHMKAIGQLKEELKARETKVHDLDRLLQEKIMSIARLRNQLTNLETSQAEAIKRMGTEYRQKILQIEEERDKTIADEVESKLQNIVNQCLEQEISFAQDEISALQDKLSEKTAEVETLRNDVSTHMQRLMLATSELQKLQEDSAMLDGLFQDVETLECERHSLSEKLHEKDIEIAELSAEILKLEIEKELAGQNAVDAQALSDKLDAAERESEASMQRLQEVEAAYEGLACEIRRINEDNDETVIRIRSEYDEAISEMQRKLQLAETASQSDAVMHAEALSAKDTTITTHIASLEVEVRHWHTQALELERQIVESTLEREAEVGNLKQTVEDLREDNGDLRRSAKESAQLMEESTSKYKRSVVEADNKIDKLEDQVRQLQATIADLEHQANASSRGYQQEIDNLNRQIVDTQATSGSSATTFQAEAQEYKHTIDRLNQAVADMKRERDFTQMSLDSAQRKVDDQAVQLTQMAQSRRELAATESMLREECRKLGQSLEKTRDERDKLLVGMEREMSRRDSRQEEALRHELTLAEQKLVSHEQQMVTLEDALQDRVRLLADMVAHNKELQTKLDRGDSQFKAMEARSSDLQVRLLDTEDELRQLQAQWKQQEDDYLGKIHSEHNLREICELDLAAATARLEAVRVESRDLNELEKENNLLKDKIRRQEAYLQRKIEQEKAARERAVPGSSTKGPASAIKASASARTSKGPPARNLGSDLASRATRSTIPEAESLDIDLDTLLAD